MIRQLVLLICSFTVAGVLAGSALGKLRARAQARDAVRALTGLTGRRAAGTATALVTAEAALAVALLVPVLRSAAAVGAVLLFAAFTAALVRVLRAGTRVACACFGRAAAPIAPRHVVRNLLLLAASLAVPLLGPPAGAGSGSGEAPGPAVVLLAAGAAALPVLLVVFLDEAVDLLRPPRPVR
ncbi:MauE/DoxX family redox-associated membrane protein [Kitasatospora sp. NPDC054939]